MDEDRTHHLRRELEELELAEAATDPAVREAHLKLASWHRKSAENQHFRDPPAD
ncbi:MAG: hypothetical protein AB7G25_04610 [Sphingomonadaceae bacterium]